ncbi:MAG: GDP-mannose 4,6-dehydratase [Oligoflexales bacterium]|nr:GDP-mannose 4,6-dehydratase [Oligoflexales bacterium]
MRVLVVGASGFVGPYLVRELLRHDHHLLLLSPNGQALSVDQQLIPTLPCLLSDEKTLRSLIREYQPEAVVHLAGISQVAFAEKEPIQSLEINFLGTKTLCSALELELKQRCRLLYVSSSYIYGSYYSESGEVKIDETSPAHPDTIYGFSKYAGEFVVQSADPQKIDAYIVRAFNHIGPKQASDFVCMALAMRIKGTPDFSQIEVGNMETYRDFSDVRDIVRAYRLIIEKAPPNKTFILGSGRCVAIKTIFDKLLDISGKNITVRVNSDLYRPEKEKKIMANTQLAQVQLGWTCEIALDQTLSDIYKSI